MLAIVALALAPYVNHLPLPPDDRRVPLPRFGLTHPAALRRTVPESTDAAQQCRTSAVRRVDVATARTAGPSGGRRSRRAAPTIEATEEGAGHLHAVKLFETTQADVNLEAERTSGVAAAADSLSRK